MRCFARPDPRPRVVRHSGGDNALAGEYSLVITPRNNASVIHGPISVSLKSGDILDYVLFDADGGGTPIQLEAYRY